MDMNDVLQALFRWIHFLSGITWIGMLAGAGHYPSIDFNLLWFIIVLALGAGLAYYMIFKFASGVAKTWP
ncbi:MAG: hypothetical protein ACRERD_15730 [Candidatus Binatia bacterium]